MKQEILMGPELRRRWSDCEKISILIEAAEPDTTVAEIARRHGITRQHIHQWRSDMRQGRLADENGGPFLSVEFVDHPKSDPEPPEIGPCDALVEVTLRKGRVLRVPASVPGPVLTSLIRAAEAA
ncbi:MAG: transposase [Paracoccaceae bacterium]